MKTGSGYEDVVTKYGQIDALMDRFMEAQFDDDDEQEVKEIAESQVNDLGCHGCSPCDTVFMSLYGSIVAAGHEGISVPGWRRKQEAMLMVFSFDWC